MTSRMKINGKVVMVGPGSPPHPPKLRPETEDGRPLSENGQLLDPKTGLIVSDRLTRADRQVETALRSGRPHFNKDHGLTYRVIDHADPGQGFATMEFWLRRYGVLWGRLRDWCLQGWFDAVYEVGSPTPRYRCRVGEDRLFEDLAQNPPSEHEVVMPGRMF